MKGIIYGATLFCSMYLAQSCSNGTTANTDSVDSAKTANQIRQPVARDAADFAVSAANGGMMEAGLGRMAAANAYSKRVKDFGAMMEKDHSEVNMKLKSLAATLQIVLPDSVSNDSRQEMDKLAKKKGKDFDKAYMDMMLDDHKTDIAAFRKAADNLSDSALKNFAATTLPTLEKHLDSAQAITGKK